MVQENFIRKHLDRNVKVDETRPVKLLNCYPRDIRKRLLNASDDVFKELIISDINELKKDYVVITNPYLDLNKIEKVSLYYLLGKYEFVFINKNVEKVLNLKVPISKVRYWIGKEGNTVKYISRKVSGILGRHVRINITEL